MSSRHHPDPLDNEERELAQRLARLAAPTEPSPSLDANILAAAHAAATKRPASRLQRRPRWPVAFGVAASLALAVGVAWQLRPLPHTPVYEEVTAAGMDAAATVGGPSADAAAVSAPAPRMASPSPAETMERHRSSAKEETEDSQAKSVAAGGEEAPSAVAATSAQRVFDAPVPTEPAASPPPPPTRSATPDFVPAPPASPVPPMEQRTRAEQAARASNSQSRAAPSAASKPRDAAANDVLSDADAAAEASDEGFDERPPNTADAPEVRQAWLQRIRELIASGDTTGARDSLQEFKRRYPGVALPDDLRRFDRPL